MGRELRLVAGVFEGGVHGVGLRFVETKLFTFTVTVNHEFTPSEKKCLTNVNVTFLKWVRHDFLLQWKCLNFKGMRVHIEERFAVLRRSQGVSIDQLAGMIGRPSAEIEGFEAGRLCLHVNDVMAAVYLLGGSYDWFFWEEPIPCSPEPHIRPSRQAGSTRGRDAA